MTRPTTRCLLAAAALTLGATPALAQPEALENEIITATQMNASARAAVDAYTEGWAQLLRSRDNAERESARRALLVPLHGEPTPAFRIQYGSRLKNELTRFAAGDESQALFAAELAGRLATVDAHAVVLELLDAPRPAIRYAAARAARLQLEAIDNPPAALNDQHRSELIEALGARIAVEQDAVALDGLLTAASDAVERDSDHADAILERHSAALAENLQGGTLESDIVPGARAVLRAVAAVQQRYRNQNRLPSDLAREGGLLAGSAMGYVLDAIENDAAAGSDASAAALEQLVKAAHSLAFFATRASGVSIVADEGIPDAFARWRQSGDPRALRTEIETWIGPGGVITRPPFNADPADFPGLN